MVAASPVLARVGGIDAPERACNVMESSLES
jgi:hypothetical protein